MKKGVAMIAILVLPFIGYLAIVIVRMISFHFREYEIGYSREDDYRRASSQR